MPSSVTATVTMPTTTTTTTATSVVTPPQPQFAYADINVMSLAGLNQHITAPDTVSCSKLSWFSNYVKYTGSKVKKMVKYISLGYFREICFLKFNLAVTWCPVFKLNLQNPVTLRFFWKEPFLREPTCMLVTIVPPIVIWCCLFLQLQLFQAHPQLKQFVRPAIERAVQELLPPVVERSIKIALTTCEQIVKKVGYCLFTTQNMITLFDCPKMKNTNTKYKQKAKGSQT